MHSIFYNVTYKYFIDKVYDLVRQSGEVDLKFKKNVSNCAKTFVPIDCVKGCRWQWKFQITGRHLHAITVDQSNYFKS